MGTVLDILSVILGSSFILPEICQFEGKIQFQLTSSVVTTI